MNIQGLTFLRREIRFLIPKVIFTSHTETCPVQRLVASEPCSTKTNGAWKPKRLNRPGKVRFGFIPEDYFVFFYPKTGVTGPYLFGILLANYLISKEIYVMEHDYYIGLSILVIIIYGNKKLGPILAASLDKDVDAFETNLNATRKEEEAHYESIIKEAKDAQWRANGQKLLMDAKKENVAMQLEAAFRERQMHVFRTVKRRLDYHMHLEETEQSSTTSKLTDTVLSDPKILCKLQPVSYDCEGNGQRRPFYYYDIKLEDCRSAYFSNCTHNLNKFISLKDCHNSCREPGMEPLEEPVRKEIFCRLQHDFGECNSYYPMWYFDMTSRTCRGFSYSGCGVAIPVATADDEHAQSQRSR
ncbi:unnamed protein product, partial [Iphiclides podalirius]